MVSVRSRVLISSKIRGLDLAVKNVIKKIPSVSSKIDVIFRDEDDLDDDECKTIDVLVCDPPTFIPKHFHPNKFPKLRWLQSTFAGVDAITKCPKILDHLRQSAIVTRAGGKQASLNY